MADEGNALTAPVNVDLRLADHFAVIVHSWRRLGYYWVLASVLAVLVWSIGWFDDDCRCVRLADFPWQFLLGVGGLLTAVFLLLTPVLSFWRTRRVLKGQPIITQLFERGVRVIVPNGEGVNYWPSLKRVVATDKRLMFYLGACSAYVVPKRCVEDAEEFALWTSVAKERFARSREGK